MRAFIFYRIKKGLLGLGRHGLLGPQSAQEGSDGKFSENPATDDAYESNKSPDGRPMTSKALLEAGLDGGKSSNWMPEVLDYADTAEAGRLIKKLVTPISRRRKQGYKRKTVNLRSTIHHNMHYGGTQLKLRWQMKKPSKPRVLLIMDTSSSMIRSARMMLQFLYALQHELRSIEVFIFGNQLNYVTPYLQRDFQALLTEVSLLPQWNFAGTELWRPMAQLTNSYPHLLTGRTVVILLTDCQFYEKYFAMDWLERLRRRVKRLYLFNPDPRTRQAEDIYYQETISHFKTVVDRMFYTETIYEVASSLRKIMS